MLCHDGVQVHVELLGVLVHHLHAPHIQLHVRLRCLHNHGEIFVALPHRLQEFHAGERVLCSVLRESAIADDAEQMVLILLIDRHSLLVVTCQQHLRTSTHSQHLGCGVQRLGGEVQALGQDVLIQMRQNGGIEPDVVLYQQHAFHACLGGIVGHVHLILYQLDDREDEVCIAQPAKDVFKDAQVEVLHTSADAMREGCQHHARCLGRYHLHLTRHVKGIIVGIARHTDYEVIDSMFYGLTRLLYRAHLGERRGIAQA